jgi:hypothetical protein
MPRDVVVAAAASVGVVAAARLTRLVTKDHWPPMAYVRNKYVELTEGTEWSVLAECPFCVAPYVVAADLAWAMQSQLDTKWWVVNGWLAASYAASLIVVRDDVPERTIKVKGDEESPPTALPVAAHQPEMDGAVVGA